MADPARRSLPSVDAVLRRLGDTGLARPVAVAIVRRELAILRAEADAPDAVAVEMDAVLGRVRTSVAALAQQRLRPVINATGVIVHTNLGRAPLSPAAANAVAAIASRYNTLELDLDTGQRGGRGAFLETHLAVLCHAEAAVVVNNCAAALVLILKALAARPPRTHVIISRGELVQIGGGFRVPDILEASGATLREVGTTNQTTADDYRRAVDDRTAMILRVHRSNFYMGGFVASPSVEQLAVVAREAGVPLVEDLGSGITFDTASIAPDAPEPTPAESLRRGVDLVCFSGDKLLGGPQAGIIVGRADLVSAMKRDPFFRALRVDRLITAALEATVDQLLSGRAADVPVRAMIDMTTDALRERARRVVAALADVSLHARVGDGVARIGGGAMPQTQIPSVAVDLAAPPGGLDALAHALRAANPPVIGYVADARLKLDLRTVFPDEDDALIRCVREAVAACVTVDTRL